MKPPYRSRVVEWNEEQGYGILSIGENVLTLSAKDFRKFHRPPKPGDHVLHGARRIAGDAVIATDAMLLRSRGLFYDLRSAWPTLFLVLPILAFLVAPMPLSIWYVAAFVFVVSVTTYLLFHCTEFLHQGIGKIRPDSALHFLELLGGWPGSLAAQKRLHHYERNLRYQFFFWITVLLWQGVAIDGVFDWNMTRQVWGSVTPVVAKLAAFV